MSIPFNSGYNGIIQRIERELGFNPADISGNTTRMGQFTADVNLALDDALAIIIPASGTWKYDDSNQTDYPIIFTNLVSGQRDYAFTTDGSNNLILDIYKVFVANSSGIFVEIAPVDVETGNYAGQNQYPASGQLYSGNTTSFTDGRNTAGMPNRYDKQANAIFLDPIPNFSYSGGLKVYVNREGSYFTVSDTTKKPGIDGRLHEYLVVNPAYKYAAMKNLANVVSLEKRKLLLERSMSDIYGRRPRDEKKRLSANVESCE